MHMYSSSVSIKKGSDGQVYQTGFDLARVWSIKEDSLGKGLNELEHK